MTVGAHMLLRQVSGPLQNGSPQGALQERSAMDDVVPKRLCWTEGLLSPGIGLLREHRHHAKWKPLAGGLFSTATERTLV